MSFIQQFQTIEIFERKFNILQYNVCVSKDKIITSLLRDEIILKYDVITIQKF